MDSELGLRDQRKRRTRAALSAAAIGLVAEGGIEALRADNVAARAGVSRRTFFNYFPRVEDALTASIEQVTEDTVEALVARPRGETMRESVCAVLGELLEDPVFEQARVLEVAATTSPGTRRFLGEFCDSQTQAIETALRRRIGENADPVYIAGLATCAAALFARLTRLSVELDGIPGADTDAATIAERHRERVWQAFDLLFTGFDEAAATTERDDL